MKLQVSTEECFVLLIEPCGIEMRDSEGKVSFYRHLLIEPCGIEIKLSLHTTIKNQTFNRTLWN